eukprot:m.141801 g.141801  ORF g.141801 m.141801 type:complete len:162 (+) comp10027_c0_seq3:85-570(+)
MGCCGSKAEDEDAVNEKTALLSSAPSTASEERRTSPVRRTASSAPVSVQDVDAQLNTILQNTENKLINVSSSLSTSLNAHRIAERSAAYRTRLAGALAKVPPTLPEGGMQHNDVIATLSKPLPKSDLALMPKIASQAHKGVRAIRVTKKENIVFEFGAMRR